MSLEKLSDPLLTHILGSISDAPSFYSSARSYVRLNRFLKKWRRLKVLQVETANRHFNQPWWNQPWKKGCGLRGYKASETGRTRKPYAKFASISEGYFTGNNDLDPEKKYLFFRMLQGYLHSATTVAPIPRISNWLPFIFPNYREFLVLMKRHCQIVFVGWWKPW